MRKAISLKYLVLLALVLAGCLSPHPLATRQNREITPNDFKGTDTQRILQAVKAASGTTHLIRIPAGNANGTRVWMIDSAILLPSDMTVILDNCTLQLSDPSRDNMFRSDNVGIGIVHPAWNKNIRIIGIGSVTLKGAANPRATGDGARKLSLDPEAEQQKGNWRVSYGSDAGKEGRKQTGDWRNIMILMAYVDGFELRNISIENAHAWSVSFERTRNAELTDIRIHNSEYVEVNGRRLMTSNKDGIDLRQGCKHFRLERITGVTGDDFIALSNLGSSTPALGPAGSLRSTMVTPAAWSGPEDDIEQIFIRNISCGNRYRGIAIRASGAAAIHHVFIDGLNFSAVENRGEALLLGGKGYGRMSERGKISDIYAMNVMGNGFSLARIEAPVRDCYFMNGMYYGNGQTPVLYTIGRDSTENVSQVNWLKVSR
ncbi:glycosyl hydrolase family 28 protein [Compostibacter hankyongensis]|uniref:Uncharacterized protein n=1 Tax=Compostibacter hankyongensis TaxID=1007089 RepID=A0ABP8FCQ3_9BACT